MSKLHFIKKYRKYLTALSAMFLILILFQNFAAVDVAKLPQKILKPRSSLFVEGMDLKRAAQGIWKFDSEYSSLYLISQDPDGGAEHNNVVFYLVKEYKTHAEVLLTFTLPAGTHAQSLYAEKIDAFNYNIYTENVDRRGLSWFKLRFGRNLLNTQMSYEGDIYPRNASGNPILINVFGVNKQAGLVVVGSLSSKGLKLQRYDANSFFKSLKSKGSSFLESRAVAKFAPIMLTNVVALQGVGLSNGKAYVLRGSRSKPGDADKNIYEVDFRTEKVTNLSISKVWSKEISAEPEGLYVQGNTIIFGLQGHTEDPSNSKRKAAVFQLYKHCLAPSCF